VNLFVDYVLYTVLKHRLSILLPFSAGWVQASTITALSFERVPFAVYYDAALQILSSVLILPTMVFKHVLHGRDSVWRRVRLGEQAGGVGRRVADATCLIEKRRYQHRKEKAARMQ
jgi:hypothetical protein